MVQIVLTFPEEKEKCHSHKSIHREEMQGRATIHHVLADCEALPQEILEVDHVSLLLHLLQQCTCNLLFLSFLFINDRNGWFVHNSPPSIGITINLLITDHGTCVKLIVMPID